MASAVPKDEATRLIYTPNVIHNSALNTTKFLSSCFAGAVAGILGLENWAGFALFAVATLFSAACLYVINCRGRPSKYAPGGVRDLVNPGQDNIFSFILVWTLFFGASRSLFQANAFPFVKANFGFPASDPLIPHSLTYITSCILSRYRPW